MNLPSWFVPFLSICAICISISSSSAGIVSQVVSFKHCTLKHLDPCIMATSHLLDLQHTCMHSCIFFTGPWSLNIPAYCPPLKVTLYSMSSCPQLYSSRMVWLETTENLRPLRKRLRNKSVICLNNHKCNCEWKKRLFNCCQALTELDRRVANVTSRSTDPREPLLYDQTRHPEQSQIISTLRLPLLSSLHLVPAKQGWPFNVQSTCHNKFKRLSCYTTVYFLFRHTHLINQNAP